MSISCEIPQFNADEEEIIELLKKSKTIAIVGLSTNPEKDSYQVGKYLKENGYKIIPVNPKYQEILGEKSYKSLLEVPEKIDIVDVFRRPSAIPEIAEQTLKLNPLPKGFWMQLGIANNKAGEMLKEKGIIVVQSKCIKVVHSMIKDKL